METSVTTETGRDTVGLSADGREEVGGVAGQREQRVHDLLRETDGLCPVHVRTHVLVLRMRARH